MSSTASTKDSKEKFSPFAGCIIVCIILLLLAGIVGYSSWSYYQVKDTIAGFTEENAKELEILSTSENSEPQKALTNKLSNFGQRITKRQKSSLTLNATELNLAVASYDVLKPNRGKIFIQSISEKGIEAEVSYPVKSGFKSDNMRSLNGSVTILPELVDGSLFPTVISVKTPKKDDIPQEFKKFISESMLYPLRNDPEIGDLFKRLSSVEIVGNSISLETDPTHKSDAVLPDDTSPIINRFMKGFAIVAVIFLLIVSVILFLANKKSKTDISK